MFLNCIKIYYAISNYDIITNSLKINNVYNRDIVV